MSPSASVCGKKTSIALLNDKLFYCASNSIGTHDSIFQHLHFICDNQPMVGEWYLIMGEGQPVKRPEGFNDDEYINCFTIVASTDRALGLPWINDDFVVSFVKKYNDETIINEVEIGIGYSPSGWFTIEENVETDKPAFYDLKVRKDKSIIINNY